VNGVDVDRNGLEVLDGAECLRLLAHATIGRIGLSVGALPTILPVNFLLDDGRILIRTGSGTKLDAALRDAVVAFEVDHIDPVDHGGWSVCVTGVAREVRDPSDLARIHALPLAHWTPNGVSHVIEVSTEIITGRRIVRP
jgi:nitroimidazol reductase NimA-like FMN-containing flavoprotein (pyridoxamine 5'-phosphate oxidase superfamily)